MARPSIHTGARAMAKAFSVASWNVEHFKGDPGRVERVVGFLRDQDPDVFALFEVEGATVFDAVTSMMPDYTFHITEGPQVQETLIGVRQGFTAFFTQKVEFRSGVSLLRPGALLTVTIDGANYALLFLHTKSGSDPRGLGLRDDMLVRACKFRGVLDKAAGANGRANYIFLGDLNTMGMRYPYVRSEDIEVENELRRLDALAKRRKMRRLPKPSPTWWGGSDSIAASELDHVVAADHIEFRKFGGFELEVRGWPQLPTIEDQRQWTTAFSDHALLYFEVQRT